MADLDGLNQSWRDFCNGLFSAGDAVLRDSSYSVDERAQGLRVKLRNAVAAIEWRLERTDSDFPVFYRMNDDRPSWAANVDVTYLRSQVDGDKIYRVHCEPGGRLFVLYAATGDYSRPLEQRYLGERWSKDLTSHSDGSFDITVGGDPTEGNWIPLASGEPCWLAIRQYFVNWEDRNIPGFFSIDRIGGPIAPVASSAKLFSERMTNATTWLNRVFTYFPYEGMEPMTAANTNMLPLPRLDTEATTQRIEYARSYYDLNPDEALLIEMDAPRNANWNLATFDIWNELVDCHNRQASLNPSHAHFGGDGLLRVVISEVDAGHPNWLDTGTNRRGILWFRRIFSPGADDEPSQSGRAPVSTVVAAHDLWRHVPSDTPRVTMEARRLNLAQRREHIARQFVR